MCPVTLVSDWEKCDSIERVLHDTRQVESLSSQLRAPRAVLAMCLRKDVRLERKQTLSKELSYSNTGQRQGDVTEMFIINTVSVNRLVAGICVPHLPQETKRKRPLFVNDQGPTIWKVFSSSKLCSNLLTH